MKHDKLNPSTQIRDFPQMIYIILGIPSTSD